MGGVRSSITLLQSLARGRGLDAAPFRWGIVAAQRACRGARAFASDTDPGSTAGDEQQEEKKTDLGRWWQTFSEQRRLRPGNLRRTKSGENWANQSPFPKDDKLVGQEQQNASGGESESGRWLIRNREEQLGQEEGKEQGLLNKETMSRWFPAKTEGLTAGQEGGVITGSQVDTGRLNLSRPKSSDGESSDGSRLSWLGLSKETPESERERLEVSMQRLALMSKLGENSQASSFMFLPPKDELLRKYFRWNNLSSPEKHKAILTKVRQEFQTHKTDCGSSQVQIAQLTTKIKYMTKHMETHRKDYHSRKGLEAMVQQRRKILKYLRRTDWDAYCDVIRKLGLRDNVMERRVHR